MPRRRRRSSDDETDWTQWVVIYFGTMISLGVMMMLVDVLSFVARSFMNSRRNVVSLGICNWLGGHAGIGIYQTASGGIKGRDRNR